MHWCRPLLSPHVACAQLRPLQWQSASCTISNGWAVHWGRWTVSDFWYLCVCICVVFVIWEVCRHSYISCLSCAECHILQLLSMMALRLVSLWLCMLCARFIWVYFVVPLVGQGLSTEFVGCTLMPATHMGWHPACASAFKHYTSVCYPPASELPFTTILLCGRCGCLCWPPWWAVTIGDDCGWIIVCDFKAAAITPIYVCLVVADVVVVSIVIAGCVVNVSNHCMATDMCKTIPLPSIVWTLTSCVRLSLGHWLATYIPFIYFHELTAQPLVVDDFIGWSYV